MCICVAESLHCPPETINIVHRLYCCFLVGKSCLTLVTPWTVAPPGSSVHGILQARILEWVAISSSRGIFRTQGSNLPPDSKMDL